MLRSFYFRLQSSFLWLAMEKLVPPSQWLQQGQDRESQHGFEGLIYPSFSPAFLGRCL